LQPRNEKTISNRAALAKSLHLEKIIHKNKQRGNGTASHQSIYLVVVPYSTMLEMMCSHHSESRKKHPDEERAPRAVKSDWSTSDSGIRPATAPSGRVPPPASAVPHVAPSKDLVVEDIDDDLELGAMKITQPKGITMYSSNILTVSQSNCTTSAKATGCFWYASTVSYAIIVDNIESEPISDEESRALKSLVFGKRAIPDDWKQVL